MRNSNLYELKTDESSIGKLGVLQPYVLVAEGSKYFESGKGRIEDLDLLMMTSRGRGLRAKKLEKPRPRRMNSGSDIFNIYRDFEEISYDRPDGVADDIEELISLFQEEAPDDLHMCSLIGRISKQLRIKGMQWHKSYETYLEPFFGTVKSVLHNDIRLGPLPRTLLLELVELRANRWTHNEEMKAYYAKKLEDLEANQKRYTEDGNRNLKVNEHRSSNRRKSESCFTPGNPKNIYGGAGRGNFNVNASYQPPTPNVNASYQPPTPNVNASYQPQTPNVNAPYQPQTPNVNASYQPQTSNCTPLYYPPPQEPINRGWCSEPANTRKPTQAENGSFYRDFSEAYYRPLVNDFQQLNFADSHIQDEPPLEDLKEPKEWIKESKEWIKKHPQEEAPIHTTDKNNKHHANVDIPKPSEPETGTMELEVEGVKIVIKSDQEKLMNEAYMALNCYFFQRHLIVGPMLPDGSPHKIEEKIKVSLENSLNNNHLKHHETGSDKNMNCSQEEKNHKRSFETAATVIKSDEQLLDKSSNLSSQAAKTPFQKKSNSLSVSCTKEEFETSIAHHTQSSMTFNDQSIGIGKTPSVSQKLHPEHFNSISRHAHSTPIVPGPKGSRELPIASASSTSLSDQVWNEECESLLDECLDTNALSQLESISKSLRECADKKNAKLEDDRLSRTYTLKSLSKTAPAVTSLKENVPRQNTREEGKHEERCQAPKGQSWRRGNEWQQSMETMKQKDQRNCSQNNSFCSDTNRHSPPSYHEVEGYFGNDNSSYRQSPTSYQEVETHYGKDNSSYNSQCNSRRSLNYSNHSRRASPGYRSSSQSPDRNSLRSMQETASKSWNCERRTAPSPGMFDGSKRWEDKNYHQPNFGGSFRQTSPTKNNEASGDMAWRKRSKSMTMEDTVETHQYGRFLSVEDPNDGEQNNSRRRGRSQSRSGNRTPSRSPSGRRQPSPGLAHNALGFLKPNNIYREPIHPLTKKETMKNYESFPKHNRYLTEARKRRQMFDNTNRDKFGFKNGEASSLHISYPRSLLMQCAKSAVAKQTPEFFETYRHLYPEVLILKPTKYFDPDTYTLPVTGKPFDHTFKMDHERSIFEKGMHEKALHTNNTCEKMLHSQTNEKAIVEKTKIKNHERVKEKPIVIKSNENEYVELNRNDRCVSTSTESDKHLDSDTPDWSPKSISPDTAVGSVSEHQSTNLLKIELSYKTRNLQHVVDPCNMCLPDDNSDVLSDLDYPVD